MVLVFLGCIGQDGCMPDARIIEGIELKFNALDGDLDERGRRRWAATEAMALGRGGMTAVAIATGWSDRTIRTGIAEFRSETPISSSRQCKPGGGRNPLEHSQRELVAAIDRIVEPTERGEPESPLRWTCKSLTNLAEELQRNGYAVGRTKISKVLRSLGYSLQSHRKTREGVDHPDRNAQFEYIARRVAACRRGKRPAISVDTKKKEILGRKANAGREYRPKGEPLEVDTHDFPDKDLGKAIPYGVYDIDLDEAWVSVGIVGTRRSSPSRRFGDGGNNWARNATADRLGC
jgi:Rhodopirellula transposase DDE domain